MNNTILVALALVMNAPLTDDSAFWRSPRNCGRLAVFGYLSILEQSPEMQVIERMVPIGKEGSNLNDMNKACNYYGSRFQVVYSSDKDLDALPTPCIVHFDVSSGHYLILLRRSQVNATIADFTVGKIQSMPIDYFKSKWSGYAIVETSIRRDSFVDRALYFSVIGTFVATLSFVLYNIRG